MNRITDEPFLTPAEAARVARLSVKSIYRLINEGKVPAIRVAGSLRVPTAWRDALMRAAGQALAESIEANGGGLRSAGEGSAGA
jgi:excisionase family DNA binding protein